MNEEPVSHIQHIPPEHTIIYIGGDCGFSLSGIFLGETHHIQATEKLGNKRQQKSDKHGNLRHL